MATETLEAKTQEADSTFKEENGVAVSEKETEKKEVKDEDMEEKDEEEKTGKRGKSSEKEPVTPVSERPTRERKKTTRYISPTPPRSFGSKPVSIEQV